MSQNILYLDKSLNNDQTLLVKQKFSEIQYRFWEEKHQSFISAMKLEKFTYTIIGFIIVSIAGFTLMSMMSLSVMQKVPQIGILRAMGIENNEIIYIFTFQAIITSIISSVVGILFSLFLIYLDEEQSSKVILKHLADYDLSVMALRDPKHQLVALTGVEVTPEAVVFNATRGQVYRGRIDDRFVTFGTTRPSPNQRDLREILQKILSNRLHHGGV